MQNGELNPCCKREKLKEVLLGHQPYRMAKALWDHSMVEKHETGEHARLVVVQDPCDTVKAGLLESQTSEMEFTSLVTTCWDGADRIGRLISRRLKPPSVGRRPARPFKGTNEGPKSCSDVQLDETRDHLRVARPMVTERP